METKTICGESLEQNQAHLIPDLRFKDIAPKVGKQTSEEIDSHLSEGHMQLKLQRFGLGKDTRYHVIPVS